MGVATDVGGDRVATHVRSDRVTHLVLTGGELGVQASHLGIGETDSLLVAATEVDAVDHVRCRRGCWDVHEQVASRGIAGRLDDGGRHEERRVHGRAGDLFDPLGQPLKDDRRQDRRSIGDLFHTDDEGAGVDGELSEVASQFLVRGTAGFDFALEVEVMSLFKTTIRDRGRELLLGRGHPAKTA
ncbi:hypothetical protein ASF38_00050 [Aeromicrobium sp. Leaf272]|nr:hypothetical protein ASF38_00050 [Aeromicrobium sp. Leaf272]